MSCHRLFLGPWPFALGLTKIDPGWRNILLGLVILPFWTSLLLRVHAWMGLMGRNNWFNTLLNVGWNWLVPQSSAVSSIPMMHSNFADVLVMDYTYLPFMILPLYANLERLDPTLDEAAMDLGTKPRQVMRDVTLPVISPAILLGWLLAFTISMDDVVISTSTTGPGATTLPILIWSKVKLGVAPDVNALGTLTVLVVAIGVFTAVWPMNRTPPCLSGHQ